MKHKALVLLFFFVLSATSGFAGERLSHTTEIFSVVTGTVRAIGGTSLDIEDEKTGTVKRFVYLDRTSPYRPGDRVRVYYDRVDNVVMSIKKMTVLEYSKDGQNLGYVTKN